MGLATDAAPDHSIPGLRVWHDRFLIGIHYILSPLFISPSFCQKFCFPLHLMNDFASYVNRTTGVFAKKDKTIFIHFVLPQ
ncbi:hypothetical protein CEXT_594201 [Caerostris extrusa]|uniref:Uncharacterized protein n=1 Tax=Caerostris extrusa TaxID=172846 RepID=A0AAV4SY76_CAEEX|nr:hypothetical protein CEXT_594201 [Caerostris extrusa]